MTSILRSALGQILAISFLFVPWLAQVTPLGAVTFEADWKFESHQDDASNWWQTLSIQTVPGVVYRLQKSNNLAAGNWETIATTYGTGEEWVNPLFPGLPPTQSGATATTSAPIPSTVSQNKFAYLILEKTTTDGVLISWSSLDDHTPRRTLLSGVTLYAVWDEFDSGYFNHHGDYLFAISPRIHSPVTFLGTSPTLGTEDSAMVAAFTAALPAITQNITNSVANATLCTPQPENPNSKCFYRYAADWGVDSDGDGRFDWQELILDGNNPFAADSDGDGTPDQASVESDSTDDSEEYPIPTDAQGLTPHAIIEMQSIDAYRDMLDYHNGGDPFLIDAGVSQSAEIGLTETQENAMRNASSYASFKSVVDQFSFGNVDWSSYGAFNNYDIEWHEALPGTQTYSQYYYHRSRFRLKLDAPAPAEGYHVPLYLAKIIQTYNTTTEAYDVTNAVRVEVMLDCEAGETEGIPKELSNQYPVENTLLSYLPSVISANRITVAANMDVTVLDSSDGVCLPLQGSFQAMFPAPTENFAGTKIYWRSRRLKGDGMFEGWKKMAPGPTANPYEGNNPTITPAEAGVFQFEALLTFPNGNEIEFPYVRMQDARSIKDSSVIPLLNALQQAGSPDFFGVTSNQLSLEIRNKAVKWLGSTKYSFNKNVEVDFDSLWNPDMTNKDKCTLFVTHVSRSVGATTPYYYIYHLALPVPHAAPAREDWYNNPGDHIHLADYGWSYGNPVTSIEPGRVIVGFGTGHATGHAAILDYDGTWIGAGPKTINKFINIQNMDAHYKPFAIRQRYQTP